MSNSFDLYKKIVTKNGRTNTDREVAIDRFKKYVKKDSLKNPAYKSIKVGDKEMNIMVNDHDNGDEKTFECLPDESIPKGSIIDWGNNGKWLVTKTSNDDELYQRNTMNRCNYVLRWQNENLDIIERDCVVSFPNIPYIASSSEDKVVTVNVTKSLIKIPYDEETAKIKEDDRFFVTRSKVNPTPYEVENVDDVINIKDGVGYISISLKRTQINEQEDNKKLLICNYKKKEEDKPITENNLKSVLVAKPKSIVIGFKGTVLTASFTNNDVVVDGVKPKWSFNCDFLDQLKLSYSEDNMKLTISTDKVGLAGKSFTVNLESEDGQYEKASIALSIKGL